VATVGAVTGNVEAAASSPTTDSPTRTLTSAETSGTTAATTEENMTSSRTRAAEMPMISDVRSCGAEPILPAPPP